MLATSCFISLLIQNPMIQREKRTIEGWTIQINTQLFEKDKVATEKALVQTAEQLRTIKRLVPPSAVQKLQKVVIWFSPEYKGSHPGAAYHPGAQWLKENGRDPIMAKGIEITNVSIFDMEVKRMPFFILHELAHSYHDQILDFNNKQVLTAFQHAKASGKYDLVQRWLGTKFADKPEKAYAMTNQMEYFAEGTEAFFGKNDFYPFNREELKQADMELFLVLNQVWNQP